MEVSDGGRGTGEGGGGGGVRKQKVNMELALHENLTVYVIRAQNASKLGEKA